jgi:peroxiredoxin
VKYRVWGLSGILAALLLYGAVRGTRPASLTRTAPDFALQSLEGRTVRLSDLRGKAVVLNFWATWCAPCRVEMPWLVELSRQYQTRGVEVVGVSMDDPGEAAAVAQFARERGVPYTILLGNDAVGDAYGGMRLLPQTFFIGRDGRIVGSLVGVKDKSALEDGIRQALGASGR